jgi:hypothetical protein
MKVASASILVLIFAASFGLTTLAAQLVPATARPVPPATTPPPPPEQLVIHGRGLAAATHALQASAAQLPFHAVLPKAPAGYELALVEGRVLSHGQAVLNLVYQSPGDLEFDVFEANNSIAKSVQAPVDQSAMISIGGSTWRYLLLAYPQPNGSTLKVHFLERAFDGSLYVSLSLRSRGDLADEKVELIEAAASVP